MRSLLASAALLVSLGAPCLPAQVRLRAGTGSRVVVSGTSNLHKWDCYTTTMTATFEGPQGAPAEIGKAATAVSVSIPVESIDCGNGTMNRNLRKALHSDEYPNIQFRMTSYQAQPIAGGSGYNATVGGALTVNGVEKPVQLKATVTPDARGGARAEGSTEIRTPDWNVPSIRAMMGTLRTGENVTIILTIIGVAP